MLPVDGAVRTWAAKGGGPLCSEDGVSEAGELAPHGKENSCDPTMIGTITHHTKLISNISVGHQHRGCGTQWGPFYPALAP